MSANVVIHGDAAAPKWAALVDDVIVPMPRRKVNARVLRRQASVAETFVIVRDHNSPDDVVLGGDQEVDLADGNVFYRLPKCDVQPRPICAGPAKMAYFVDDRNEITTNRQQTGQSLRDLFAVGRHVRLVRDLESPHDIAVGLGDPARFEDGPVFYTRPIKEGLRITVNSRIFGEVDGVKPKMSGLEIATLVYPEQPQKTKVKLQGKDPPDVGLDEVIEIKGCEVFDVTRCEVIGGFEKSRVEHEADLLKAGGAATTVVAGTTPAVIYHAVPTKPGSPVDCTDVMVLVPSGYPGAMIDGACLPTGSPLIGRVVGSPDREIELAGWKWTLISYHPHNGGGAPAWNPTKHGFHTYYSEVLSWLHTAK